MFLLCSCFVPSVYPIPDLLAPPRADVYLMFIAPKNYLKLHKAAKGQFFKNRIDKPLFEDTKSYQKPYLWLRPKRSGGRVPSSAPYKPWMSSDIQGLYLSIRCGGRGSKASVSSDKRQRIAQTKTLRGSVFSESVDETSVACRALLRRGSRQATDTPYFQRTIIAYSSSGG